MPFKYENHGNLYIYPQHAESGFMLRIKLWRLQAGLTQMEAAGRLGIGLSTLSLLEGGRLRPTRAQVERLRRLFGSEADTLFDPVQERVGAGR
jgi:transcriptional regulator with XRE-family HTH domain